MWLVLSSERIRLAPRTMSVRTGEVTHEARIGEKARTDTEIT